MLVKISVVYSMVHMLIIFFLVYEYRCSRRTFITATTFVVGSISAAILWIMFRYDVATAGRCGMLIGAFPTLFYFFLMAKERQHILEAQTSVMERRAFEVRQAEEKIAIERHDLRHRLQTVASLIEHGNPSQAMEYIESSQAVLDEGRRERCCQNIVLDAILSTYLERAAELGIQVETHLAIPDELPVDTTELSTVFANALENAIHACQELPLERRRILCTCVTQPRFMFEVSNPYETVVKFGPDGLPKSSRDGHGIGIRSIMAFAEKHNAICRFRTEDSWFKVQIAL